MAKQAKWTKERRAAASAAAKARVAKVAEVGNPAVPSEEGIPLLADNIIRNDMRPEVITVAATPTAPAPPIEEAPDKLDQLLGLVQGLTTRVAAVEAGTTKFTPARGRDDTAAQFAATYRPPAQLMVEARKNLRVGQQVSGISNGMDDPEYIQNLPPEQRPIFRSESRVRINPDAVIYGTDSPGSKTGPRLWSEILTKRNSNGEGTVMSIAFIDKTWEPKYIVHVPGVTDRNGDGFRESELLPA